MRASVGATTCALTLMSGGIVGCGFHGEDPWSDQLHPSGVCWEVNLADGFASDSTQELQAFIDCLDMGGILQPFRPLTDALDAPGPTGAPVGLGLIGWANDLLLGGVDFGAAIRQGADLLNEVNTAIELSTRVFIELVYGVPYRDVGVTVALDAPGALDAGVVVPSLPIVGELATTAATDGGLLMRSVHDVLAHPAVPDLACTAVAVARSSDPEVQDTLDGLPVALGRARVASLTPENDRWGYATGDSLRDLTARLLSNDAEAWHALTVPLAGLLRTEGLEPRVREAFEEVTDRGQLSQLPLQLRYLATVDTAGAPVPPGGGADRTALTSLLRLLARSNQPAVCQVDIGFTDLEINLGNVAVALLEYIARQDPERVAGALDLFAGVLGFALTDDILDLIAGTEACPVLDHRFVDDLQALDRLTDRESEDLLFAAIRILAALEGGERVDSSVPELVDTIEAAYDTGLVEPMAEVLIDLADSELTASAVRSIPWMLDPSSLDSSSCPSSTQTLTFSSGWNLLDDLVAPRTEAAALARLGPTVASLTADPRVWTLLDNATPLLLSTDAEVHRVPQSLVDGLSDPPNFGAIDTALSLLADESAWMPFMALAATPQVRAGLATTDAPQGGPLPYLSSLVIDGTLDDVMRTLALASELINGSPAPPE